MPEGEKRGWVRRRRVAEEDGETEVRCREHGEREREGERERARESYKQWKKERKGMKGGKGGKLR